MRKVVSQSRSLRFSKKRSVITVLSTGPGTTLVVGFHSTIEPSVFAADAQTITRIAAQHPVPCLFVQTDPSGIPLLRNKLHGNQFISEFFGLDVKPVPFPRLGLVFLFLEDTLVIILLRGD